MDNNKESLSNNEILDLLLKELQTSALYSIPVDTYQKIATAIGEIKGQENEGIESRICDSMVELMSMSAKLLIEIRYQKIKEYHNKSSSITHLNVKEAMDYSKLTDEEKYILDGEKEVEKRINAVLAATLKGRPKALELISNKIRSKQTIVRFVKPMEQFVGVDMEKYGPFYEEDVAVIPSENARSLIENGEVVEISVS
jgi:DNA replication factor GINS